MARDRFTSLDAVATSQQRLLQNLLPLSLSLKTWVLHSRNFVGDLYSITNSCALNCHLSVELLLHMSILLAISI